MRQPKPAFHLASLCAALGVLLCSLPLVGQQVAAKVPAPIRPQAATPQPKPPPKTTALPKSTPTAISIPAVNIQSSLATVGLQPDGAPAVPAGADIDNAAWLTSSVTPGEVGTSVIIGHVTTITSGPSVFYDLGNLQPGQHIHIERQDGHTASFIVNDIQTYPKDNFPSQIVYGQTESPSLRLITCGGSWDEGSGQYSHNIVAFASMSVAGQ